MSAHLRDLARMLGGEVSGGEVLCPGPGHSPKDRSLCVKLEGERLLVYSFSTRDDQRECFNYVRSKLGLEPTSKPVRREPIEKPAPKPNDSWRGIWREACDPCGTLVEKYLASRNLPLPFEAAGEALRFHPNCPFGKGRRTPAMVALVRDVRSNEPIATPRSIGKAAKSKLTAKTANGGAIKLSPDEKVTTVLGIGEGIETTLSLLKDWCGPVWACAYTGNLAEFPLLPGIGSLVVAVDHDEGGHRAAAQAIMRWHDAGRETFAHEHPRPGKDLNDLICDG
jgi:hypothetical protein